MMVSKNRVKKELCQRLDYSFVDTIDGNIESY